MWEGLIAGMAVAGLSGVAAWFLLRWSADKTMTDFLKAVLGGMAGRLVFVGIASFLVVKLTPVSRVAYAVGLMAVYLVFLLVEIAVILRRAQREKEARGEDR